MNVDSGGHIIILLMYYPHAPKMRPFYLCLQIRVLDKVLLIWFLWTYVFLKEKGIFQNFMSQNTLCDKY